MRGLSLVGWYHSHPFSHALPSLQDIDTQMDYQLKLQGTNNSFQPCLALICGKQDVPSPVRNFFCPLCHNEVYCRNLVDISPYVLS